MHAAGGSGKSDMAASNAESWARLRLVQGESSAQKWELLASQGHVTLTVGSNADCTWVVREEAVRPIHFSVHWDGSTLRVADVYNAGDVRVDGALLGSQWRPLLGRMRVEFGKAAIVVETGSGVAARSDAPSGPPTQPFQAEIAPDAKRASTTERAPRNPKGTLIGVVPSTVLPSYLQVPASGSSVPPASESARPRNEGSLKATLVGGVGMGNAPGSNKPKPNATLMGFNVAELVHGVIHATPVQPGVSGSGSSLADADQRTVQGYPNGEKASSVPPSNPSSIPGRRMTQKGVISRPPGVLEGAVSHAPVRPIPATPAPLPNERIGAAWQEVPEAEAFVPEPPAPAPEPTVPRPPRSPRVSGAGWDIGERLSELPTQMRDGSSFATARRRRRGFPWRYVGVLLLTAVAYFAWLYLLDHF